MPCPNASSSTRARPKLWSAFEDQVLLSSITATDKKDWSHIASKLEGRTGKQCRQRYNYHLEQEYKKGFWTVEEDRTIIRLQAEMGNSWSKIAKFLPGRNDNSVKNRWYSALIRHNVDSLKRSSESTTESPAGAKKTVKRIASVTEAPVPSELLTITSKDAENEEKQRNSKAKIRTTPWTWDEDQELLEAVQSTVNRTCLFLYR